jgi:cobalt-zinc-cadmium efflux system membrane fusion protein
MKTRAFFGRLALAILISQALAAHAADRPKSFPVSDQQIKALGIQLVSLDQQSEAVAMQYPAQITVPPDREQIISSPLAGMVSQILVRHNETVKQGAPLLRVMSSDFSQLQMQLMTANSKYSLAAQNAQREKALFDEGIIAQRRVQESQAALRESEAALFQAKAALRMAGVTDGVQKGLGAAGKVEDGFVLRAAKGGIVTDIEAKLGQRVDASTPLMRLTQADVLTADIQVPVSDAATWRAGTPVKVKGADVKGKLLSVGAGVAAGSQSVTLRASLEGGKGALLPGQFVTMELMPEKAAGSWDVPLSAVAHDGDYAVVFVRTSKGFDARPIKVQASAAQRLRIQGELQPNEQIAVSGIVALKGAWLDDKGGK